MKRRGVVLVMSMMISSLVIMLTAAFFQVNRGNLTTYGVVAKQRQALLAAQSGVAYVRARLESNQDWGKNKFDNVPDESFGDTLVQAVQDSHRIRGTFNSSERQQQGFEVEIFNNLNGPEEPVRLRGVRVPPDSVMLRTVGNCQGFRAQVDVTYAGEPLYDSSAVSNGPLDMTHTGKWRIGSLDKRRNWVRSNQDIRMRDVLQDGSDAVKFLYTDTTVPGVLWSRADIRSDGTVIDATNIGKASQNIEGQVASRSNLRNEIYKLKMEDLIQPTGQQPVIPGKYVVSDVPVNVPTIYRYLGVNYPGPTFSVNMRTLSRHSEVTGNDFRYYKAAEMDTLKANLEAEAASYLPPEAEWAGVETIVPEPAVPDGIRWTSDEVPLNTAGGFTFRFSDNTFDFKEGPRYQVDGNFEVGFENLAEGDKHKVKVNFPSGTESAALNVTGDVDIKGIVTGKAAVLAKGDISMEAQADLEAELDQPMVVYSEKNVTLKAQSIKQDGSQNFQLKGLLYAAGNLTLTSDKPLNQATFQGAMVAQEGAINMNTNSDNGTVSFIYDPKYLKAFTGGISGNRRRLKQATYVLY